MNEYDRGNDVELWQIKYDERKPKSGDSCDWDCYLYPAYKAKYITDLLWIFIVGKFQMSSFGGLAIPIAGVH